MSPNHPELRIGSVQLLDHYDRLILYADQWEEPEPVFVGGKIWSWVVSRKKAIP